MGIFAKDVFPIAERYDRATADLGSATVQLINRRIDVSYRDLVKEIEDGWQAIAANKSIIPQQQRILIAEQLGEVLHVVNPRERDNYTSLLNSALLKANDLGAEYYERVYPLIFPGPGTKKALQATTGVPIEALRNQVEEGVKRLYRHGDDAAREISAIVEQGLIQNWGPKKVAAAVEMTAGVVKGHADMIARTEIMSAFNGATKARAAQHGAYVLWIAIGDARTCPFCVSRNMQAFKAAEVQIPAHPRDRCNIAPLHPEWLEQYGVFDEADIQFMADYRDEGFTELAKRGLKPRSGPAPFDINGAPKPVWTATRAEAVRIGQFTAAPPPLPQEVVVSPSQAQTLRFPNGIDDLEDVRSLGGSTGAKLVRDPKTGQQFVLKRGGSAAHLREEYAADQAYQALGVQVPKTRLYETANGPVKLSEFIDGESLADILKRGDSAEVRRTLAKIQRHYASDVLLGNWDVAGLEYDNIIISARNGRAYRIDNGGALRFRAQGAPKGDRWNRYPTELFTLRDSRVNPSTARVFGDMGLDPILNQVERLEGRRARLLRSLPQELRSTVSDRLDELARVARIGRTLRADSWQERYADDFLRHSLQLRAEGIVDRLPSRLRNTRGVTVVDESGVPFDHLRGPGSRVGELQNYIDGHGGDYRLLEYWMEGQSASSWSGNSQAMKWFVASEAREAGLDEYWWRYGADSARQVFRERWLQARSGQQVRETVAAWHAWNYEFIDHVDFDNRNAVNRTVRLMRTENAQVMSASGLQRGDLGVTMKRGAIESTSIYRPVSVHGSEMTIQDVPYHRIMGMYFGERTPGTRASVFLADRENEFVAVLEGVKFDYHQRH